MYTVVGDGRCCQMDLHKEGPLPTDTVRFVKLTGHHGGLVIGMCFCHCRGFLL
jgi:hypothetical protein